MKKLILTLIMLASLIAGSYKYGSHVERLSCEIENFKVEQVVQKEIAKDVKKIKTRKAINKRVPSSDNLKWLLKNNCKNCKSR